MIKVRTSRWRLFNSRVGLSATVTLGKISLFITVSLGLNRPLALSSDRREATRSGDGLEARFDVARLVSTPFVEALITAPEWQYIAEHKETSSAIAIMDQEGQHPHLQVINLRWRFILAAPNHEVFAEGIGVRPSCS